MIYSEARPNIKTGDVLAWTHNDWKSWYGIQMSLIKMFTMSEYTHVGIAYRIGDRVMILESVGAGVRMFPLSKDLPCYWLHIEKDWWNDELTSDAMSKFGEKYSKWDGIKSVFSKIKPGTDKQWECAEYVQWLLNQGGFDINVRSTPGEVVRWIQNNTKSTLQTLTVS